MLELWISAATLNLMEIVDCTPCVVFLHVFLKKDKFSHQLLVSLVLL